MIKNLLTLVVITVAAVSCASPPSQTYAPPQQQYQQQEEKPQIGVISHQGTMLGQDIPEWVEMANKSTEAVSKLYPGKRVFIEILTGKNRNLLRKLGTKTSVRSQVAGNITVAIIDNAKEAGASTGGDYDAPAFEDTVEAGTMARLSALSKEGEWWTYGSTDGETKEYTYYFLYSMSESMFEKLIKDVTASAADKLNNTALEEAVKRGTDSTIELYNKTEKNSPAVQRN